MGKTNIRSIFNEKQRKLIDKIGFETACLEAEDFLGLEKHGEQFELLCKIRVIETYRMYYELSNEANRIICPGRMPSRKQLMNYLTKLYKGEQDGEYNTT